VAGFDMEFVDAALAQVAQRRREIDLAAGPRQVNDGGAALLQRGPPCVVLQCRIDQSTPAVHEDLGGRRRLQAAVDDDHIGLTSRGHVPHVQARIVLEDRADARQHRAGSRTPGVAVGAGGLGCDPLAGAVVQRRLAVQRGGDFHPQPGGAACHAAEEPDIEFARFLGTGADLHVDTRCAQPRETLARDQGVRIGNGGDHLADACRDECIAARTGAAVMRAGLQRHPGRRTLHGVSARGSIPQGHDLGVRLAGTLRVPGAQHLIAVG